MADDKSSREPPAQAVADLVFTKGASLAKSAFEKRLGRAGYSKKDIRKIVERQGFAKRFAAAAITRLATRSVPGALAVSSGIAAKALWNRRKRTSDEEQAQEVVEDRAE